MDELNLIQKISVFALPVIFAITGHEAAHAYAARHFGDNTAYLEGRMTLNPLRHIDWIGTVLLPLVCVAVGGFIFGWAKPVPVRFGNCAISRTCGSRSRIGDSSLRLSNCALCGIGRLLCGGIGRLLRLLNSSASSRADIR